MASVKVYKEIIGKFISVQTEDDLNKVCTDIDRAFQSEKLTWKDNEQLYKLAQLFQDKVVNPQTYNLNLLDEDESVEIGRFDTKKQAQAAYQYMIDNGYSADNLEIVKVELPKNAMTVDGKTIQF